MEVGFHVLRVLRIETLTSAVTEEIVHRFNFKIIYDNLTMPEPTPDASFLTNSQIDFDFTVAN